MLKENWGRGGNSVAESYAKYISANLFGKYIDEPGPVFGNLKA